MYILHILVEKCLLSVSLVHAYSKIVFKGLKTLMLRTILKPLATTNNYLFSFKAALSLEAIQ